MKLEDKLEATFLTAATAAFLSSVALIRFSSSAATRSCSSLTRARMLLSFLLAPSSRLLASAKAARLGATTCKGQANIKMLSLRPVYLLPTCMAALVWPGLFITSNTTDCALAPLYQHAHLVYVEVRYMWKYLQMLITQAQRPAAADDLVRM